MSSQYSNNINQQQLIYFTVPPSAAILHQMSSNPANSTTAPPSSQNTENGMNQQQPQQVNNYSTITTISNAFETATNNSSGNEASNSTSNCNPVGQSLSTENLEDLMRKNLTFQPEYANNQPVNNSNNTQQQQQADKAGQYQPIQPQQHQQQAFYYIAHPSSYQSGNGANSNQPGLPFNGIHHMNNSPAQYYYYYASNPLQNGLPATQQALNYQVHPTLMQSMQTNQAIGPMSQPQQQLPPNMSINPNFSMQPSGLQLANSSYGPAQMSTANQVQMHQSHQVLPTAPNYLAHANYSNQAGLSYQIPLQVGHSVALPPPTTTLTRTGAQQLPQMQAGVPLLQLPSLSYQSQQQQQLSQSNQPQQQTMQHLQQITQSPQQSLNPAKTHYLQQQQSKHQNYQSQQMYSGNVKTGLKIICFYF